MIMEGLCCHSDEGGISLVQKILHFDIAQFRMTQKFNL
jgi:hypothetical protein